MGASLRGAGANAVPDVAISMRGSAEADLDRSCGRLGELASAVAKRSGDLVETPSVEGRSAARAASLPFSACGRKGFAEAIITLEGAGAGDRSRSVASSIASSLPSIGARATYSTLTRATP